ncbi:MAG TPA: hypothetical protein VIT22_03125 [Pseudoxanthomonas sp.]
MQIKKPIRVTRTYTQRIAANVARVFPLLCPVREADWIDGWDPLYVVTATGVAEADCVFATAAPIADAIWYVTRYEPAAGFVEMLKITPQVTACRLSIQLKEVADGSEATIIYTHTSLGPEGDAFVDTFTEEFYAGFMRDWEMRINHYLTHGSALQGARD